MIQHVCPGCETVLRSSPRLVGLPIHCRCCRFEVTVPDRLDDSPFCNRAVPAFDRPERASRAWPVGPTLIGGAILFGAAFLVSAIALAVQRRAPAPAEEPLSKIFLAKDGRSEMRAPASWGAKSFGVLEEGELKVGSWRDEMCVKVLTEPKVILGQTMNRDEYARLVTDAMKRHLVNVTVSGPTTVLIEGRPAVRYELTGRASGGAGVFLVTVVEGESHFHQIIAVSTARSASRNRPLLEKIAQSFREVRPVAAR